MNLKKKKLKLAWATFKTRDRLHKRQTQKTIKQDSQKKKLNDEKKKAMEEKFKSTWDRNNHT